jgi:tetrahydromethanopterin S-methyltransferase subunit G
VELSSTLINAAVVAAVGIGLAYIMVDRFRFIERQFAEIDRRFEAIDHRFDAIDRRFEAIEHRIDRLDEKIDAVRGDVTALAIAMGARPRAQER